MSITRLLLVVGLPLAVVIIISVLILFRRRRPEPRGFDVVRRAMPTEPDRDFK